MTAKEKFMQLFGRALDEAMPEEKPPVAAPADDEMGARMAKIEDMLVKLTDAASKGTDEAPPSDATPAPGNEMSARLDAIEAAIAKLLEMQSGTVVDEAPPASSTAKDEAICMDQETVARAEILVPGIANSGTLVKDALEQFGKTTDGAAVLKTLDSVKDEGAKFAAAAEVMRVTRNTRMAPPSIQDFPALRAQTGDSSKPAVTPESINAANEKRYAK
jgi:hypothetical protein